ncbi:hypothetical protein H7J52_23120 [Mycobacterium gordonae]|uniref:hypothetical protein n=1 Tax=Mycobacterium gordonae TaxID=1778 RepID=UPI0021F332F3|nr:hypothetical protein [Mycobacterium gordonae]MCV7008663.1 hypothetical protein [Mycobacterium gordonae]
MAVDDEDRFAVDEGQSRALRAEVRRRRFARHREPLDLHVVTDGEKTGDVVRDFGPELLDCPHRPLAGGQ